MQGGVPMLVEIPQTGQNQDSHPAVFVGELKLSDLKQILTKAGFKTEFSGGVLLCNQTVMIKKDGDGANSRIKVEGILCDDYFKVRELVYSQYLIL